MLIERCVVSGEGCLVSGEYGVCLLRDACCVVSIVCVGRGMNGDWSSMHSEW